MALTSAVCLWQRFSNMWNKLYPFQSWPTAVYAQVTHMIRNNYDRLRIWKSSNWHQLWHFYHNRAGHFHLQSNIKPSYDKSTTILVQLYDKSHLVTCLCHATSCGTTIYRVDNYDLFWFILWHIYNVSTLRYDYHLEWSYGNHTIDHPLLSCNYRTIDHDSSYDCTWLDAVIVWHN